MILIFIDFIIEIIEICNGEGAMKWHILSSSWNGSYKQIFKDLVRSGYSPSCNLVEFVEYMSNVEKMLKFQMKQCTSYVVLCTSQIIMESGSTMLSKSLTNSLI